MNNSITEMVIPREGKELKEISNQFIEVYGFRNVIGTLHEEETYRTELRRQRDKILYTGGFRRLQDKTQVMAATLTGDHRTRLTHTLEVEQIAISVADALGLNKDLVSAIALGHDVGHTPFGHAAEKTLNQLLKENGGFNHPIQSVKYLWEKYGNKLDDKIYEGILVHDSDMFTINKNDVVKQMQWSKYRHSEESSEECTHLIKYVNEVPSTLEAQVVIWADKIAYITHDLEDFLNSQIYVSAVKADNSNQGLEFKLCEKLSKLIKVKLTRISEFKLRNLIRGIIKNLIVTSANNIQSIRFLEQSMVLDETKRRISNTEKEDKKKYLNSLIINFDDEFRAAYYELRDFLDDQYILSPTVQRSDAKAKKIVSFLYTEFIENYKLLPLEFRNKIDNELRHIAEEMLRDSILEEQEIKIIINERTNKMEDALQKKGGFFIEYNKRKQELVSSVVAYYISTMSDRYAENTFCDLNSSKDNYIL